MKISSMKPISVSLHEEFRGQRSLEDCSPWDRKESDTTEMSEHKVINKMRSNG